MMEQHEHNNNALCFYSKDFPPLSHLFFQNIMMCGVYVFTRHFYPRSFFSFSGLTFWASVVGESDSSLN